MYCVRSPEGTGAPRRRQAGAPPDMYTYIYIYIYVLFIYLYLYYLFIYL